MRIFQRLSGLWRISIRWQLIVGFGLTSLVLLLGFGYMLLAQQRDFMLRTSDDNATSLVHALAISSTSWALANDLAGLQEVVQGFAKTPDLQRAYFLNTRGEVLASTNEAEVGLYAADRLSRTMLASTATDAQVLTSGQSLIAVAHPVLNGNQRLGWVRVEMRRDSMNANLDALYNAWIGFVLFAVLVVALIAQLLARSLTRGLAHLTGVAARVASGDRDSRSDTGRLDEIGVLARHLDHMLDALLRANADLTRFADVSAHHLMEPARRLTSYSQQLRTLLVDLPDEAGELHTSLEYIERDAARLRTMIRDVQLYLAASAPRGDVLMQDSAVLLADLQLRLGAQLSALGAVLEVASVPPVMLDRPRLVDLFSLLLDNALRHGLPFDPNVTPRIRVSGERDGELSRFRVCDNGPGIPQAYLERVFEIFERLSPSGREGGSGIGLSIARRIVESRHGRIWIENLSGGGVMVVFELPDAA